MRRTCEALSRTILACVLVTVTSFNASADSFADNAVERQIPIQKLSIESAVLNESVDVFVRLPFKYDSDFTQNWRYPVLYSLDAPVGLPLLSGVMSSLVGYNNAPQMIIVGISTSNRDRDLLPTLDKNYEEHGGGADKYLAFIEQEVIPYIDENYRTEKFRILSGHSYGGLFVAHSFYKKPDLFQAHFAASPSLFWEDGQTVDNLINFIKKNPNHKNFLYMNMGNEGNPESESAEGVEMLKGVQKIEDVLSATDTPNLHYKFEYFRGESHQNTPIFGAIGALRGLYPQWAISNKTADKGFDSVMAHFEQLSNLYGYDIEPKEWQMHDKGFAQLDHLDAPGEAIKYFNHVVERNPTAYSVRVGLVRAHTKLGNKSEALKHLNILLERSDLSDEERKDLEGKKSRLSDR